MVDNPKMGAMTPLPLSGAATVYHKVICAISRNQHIQPCVDEGPC